MNRIEWAPYREEDYLWIVALHVSQERMLGRTMDLPFLDRRPVISAYVGRQDGRIVTCVFMEAEVELSAMSSVPLASADVENVAAMLMRDAQRYQIRIARAFMPVQASPAVKRILTAAGFTESNDTMTDFYRWIAQADDVEES
jgi:hypothetical protein